MPWVAGIDGCRAGWVVVLIEPHDTSPAQPLDVRLCPTFEAVLRLQPTPTVMAIDMPIGLLETPRPGGRTCDQQARRLLGRRASSVFSPPCRAILEATQYAQVRGYGMSRQAFGILPKVRAVDQVMTPGLQNLVYEAHPELAFMALAGHPMQHNKKTPAGRQERLHALTRDPIISLRASPQALQNALRTFARTQVAFDDLLDAYVLTWSAYRIASGQAGCLPPQPPLDQRGLRMEIWY
jgi:predicted RNase H-like nuclease